MIKLFKSIFVIGLVVLFIGVNGQIIPVHLIGQGPTDSYQTFTGYDFVSDAGDFVTD